MKNPSKSTALLLLCLLWAGAALSAPAGSRGQRPGGGEMQPPAPPDSVQIERMMTEMAAAVSLSEEQRVRITALHFAHFAEVEQLMAGAGTGQRPGREAMDALRKKLENSVKALLIGEQVSKFEAFSRSHGPRAPQPRASGAPGAHEGRP